MNPAIRNVIFLVVASLALNNAAAQKAAYTTNRGMTIGFGIGAAYQQSDIANSRGSGFDLSLGSYLYKKENAFLSVDWKFRFLGGENTAYDHRINSDDTYSNIRYDFYNYDLELGFTLNRLRERTRIVISGFGGIGLTNGKTSADLLDASGNPYDYSVIDPTTGRKTVYTNLKDLSDKEFETNLINKTALMPTAGIFVGYQFSRSFSIGIEHKINFSLSEDNSSTGIDMDNRIVKGSGPDMNHYTSLRFTWILRGRSSRQASRNTTPALNTPIPAYVTTPVTPTVNPPVTTVVTPPTTIPVTTVVTPRPVTTVVTPSVKPPVTTVVTQRPVTTVVTPSVKPPVTTVVTPPATHPVITNNNTVKPVQPVALPYVKFTDPATPVTVEKNIYSISVQTKNVKAWQDVTITVNGLSTSNFNFSPDGVVTTNIPLNEGVNKAEVTGKNESGISSDLATITYKKPVNAVVPVTDNPTPGTRPCQVPVLTMTEPAQNEFVTESPSCNIRIGIKNIATRDQLSVSLNDINITDFYYSGSEISFTASLNEGINNCTVAATSKCGAQKISYTITYHHAGVVVEKPCGIRINPGNASWEFCLVTTSDTITRDNLTNNDFTYSGSASSLYFKPIAGGGDAMVNGKPYTLQPGQYYLFTGNLTVTVSTKNPASMGQWSVCINADREPVSGNGNNRPQCPNNAAKQQD